MLWVEYINRSNVSLLTLITYCILISKVNDVFESGEGDQSHLKVKRWWRSSEVQCSKSRIRQGQYRLKVKVKPMVIPFESQSNLNALRLKSCGGEDQARVNVIWKSRSLECLLGNILEYSLYSWLSISRFEDIRLSKAPGQDEIGPEMLKYTGDKAKEVFREWLNYIIEIK